MISRELLILIITAASIGFFHTILGFDHYVPFIAMAKAGGWSRLKTFLITFLCSAAHVLSSVILGLFGISFGIVVARLKLVESFRGDVAGWALIAFGLVYFVWGMRKAFKNKMNVPSSGRSVLPWAIFTIFIFGPCEPLIPLVMYPAAKGNFLNVVWVTAAFGLTTMSTMLSIVMAGSFGLERVSLGRFDRFGHALAGAMICLCGLAVTFLGL